MFKKLFLMLSLALVLRGAAFGQSNLPACPESDTSSWDNCFGSQITAKGNKYIGEWKAGKREGQGALYFLASDQYMGHTYVGGFKSSKFDGSGTYTFPDGRKYVGEWKDDKQNGQGAWTWANGVKYIGEWKDGQPNGVGNEIQLNGEKYVGEFKDGLKSGRGVNYNNNGLVINSGIFVNNQRVQWDTIDLILDKPQQLEIKRIKDAAEIWLRKVELGQNEMTKCEGDVASWNNCIGELIGIKGVKYIGEFQSGKRNGQGAAYWPDGGKFVGQFSNDVRDGQGMYFGKEGRYFFGEFAFDWPNGRGVSFLGDGSVEEAGIYKNGRLASRKYVDLIQLSEEKKLSDLRKAEEKKRQEIERQRFAIENRKNELAWERLAEQKRLQEAKAAEERRVKEALEAEASRMQEAKAAEERRIQEAKDAKAAEERRIWLTTPEGKKFAAAEEAKAKKEEAERQKAAAIEEARLAESQRQENLRIAKEKANYAKEFPYYAIIDCTYGKQATPLLSCLSGSRSKIELRNGSQYGLYMPHEFQSIGTVGQYGSSLTINLRSKFSLVAENTAKYESLGVKIIDRKSDKVLWEKKVSQYDSIQVSN